MINSIANTPKEFEKNISVIKAERTKFRQTEEYAAEAYHNALKTGAGAATGVGIGAAVASMAPTAAMWVATTFGTASTGTAISALSGAVATKAALAWLGGGALAAGGGGIAGGQAFLALAGPEDKITREQAMNMIARAISITKLKAELNENEAKQLLSAFNDSKEAADWAKEYILKCIKAGIVSGKSGYILAPKEEITRAEVAVIVRQLLQKSNLIN